MDKQPFIVIDRAQDSPAPEKQSFQDEEELGIDEVMRIALDRYREDLTSSSEEEEHYETDSWDDEDSD